MLHHCFLLIGAVLSLSITLLAAFESCPASGVPGIPGMHVYIYIYMNCINAALSVFALLVYKSFCSQVYPGCLVKMVETERKEKKDSQVSSTHWKCQIISSQSRLNEPMTLINTFKQQIEHRVLLKLLWPEFWPESPPPESLLFLSDLVSFLLMPDYFCMF